MVYKVQEDRRENRNDDGNSVYFSRIQTAIDAASPGDVILIEEGVYYEKLNITTPEITLRGLNAQNCIIRFDDYAKKTHSDGNPYRTFRTYTCLVQGDGVVVENLTIENNSGDGRDVGQAIALYADGDRFECRGCRLIGYQDTLFTGPLPMAPKIPGSFIGPSENNDYRSLRQYYKACEIIGDVDYIFGSALAVFNQCQMVTRNRNEIVNGYVTAPSTWEQEPYGYVFIDCRFVGEKGVKKGTVYLGRPWRPYGHVKFIHCYYDATIHIDRWDPWGNESNRKTARFSEYSNFEDTSFLCKWHQNMLR